MSGIAAIQARVASIERRFSATPAPETTADTEGSFSEVLAGMLGDPTSTAALGGSALGSTGLGATALGSAGLGATGLGATGACRCCGCRTAPAGDAAFGGPTAAAPLGPAVRRAPGDYGRLEPPAELVGYGNGHIPAEALQPIGFGEHRLWAPAATAFVALRRDAAAAGIDIGVTDSYRDYDTQVSLARRKGLYSQGGLAATPGSSNHGWGMAVDLDLDDAAQAWMRENAWRYGFVEDTPREPWHWGFRPAGRSAA